MAVKMTSKETTRLTRAYLKKIGMESAYIERFWKPKTGRPVRRDAFKVTDTLAFNDNEDRWINQCGIGQLNKHKRDVESGDGDTLRKWLSGKNRRRYFLMGWHREFPGRQAEKKIIEYVWIHRHMDRAAVKMIASARSVGAFQWKQRHPPE